ncbi:rhodanese-related sulfurtransferase/TusA-related sulfurtransferase [Oikeobacillus pervagus]|uniref:Rhodanese-related sulfurtransferase/TusA-related sulfurtransferase n=1 Tax=Oikeobacillus pervagus TaxID=1325931 RepID=A0AAJ1T007_9BACI|nr:sulfurtransferase TusA family protein [Oikeobacillus pervagus]MDQ0215933.1 rhodanese-related sulfurtransferase/TusA-related sulfurtransferase [Oikeobacillus pervagus]
MVETNLTVDAKGLSCPMPIVKARKAMNEIQDGEVLEVLATDKGSKADIQAWAKQIGHQYLGTIEEESVLKHYIRKALSSESTEERSYEKTATNEELLKYLDQSVQIVDVREPAEYVFGHIPNAVSAPFGDLATHAVKLDKEKNTYVICRTGNRSDLACQQLVQLGFTNVWNVVPGMSQWNGPIEK